MIREWGTDGRCHRRGRSDERAVFFEPACSYEGKGSAQRAICLESAKW